VLLEDEPLGGQTQLINMIDQRLQHLGVLLVRFRLGGLDTSFQASICFAQMLSVRHAFANMPSHSRIQLGKLIDQVLQILLQIDNTLRIHWSIIDSVHQKVKMRI